MALADMEDLEMMEENLDPDAGEEEKEDADAEDDGDMSADPPESTPVVGDVAD
jgi:hypothetical protein